MEREGPDGPDLPASSNTGAGHVGRPRQMSERQRRGHLVAVAGKMFLHKGYRCTTMDEIAQRAGMSKKTVYQLFSTKSELFEALLTEWLAPFTIPIEAGGRSSREMLIDLLFRIVTLALSEPQISVTRLLIAETSHSEDIAIALERQGIGRGKGALEQWLAAERDRGMAEVSDPQEVANVLFFAAAGDFLFDMLLRIRPRPSAQAIRSRVEQTVATYFRQLT
jgi:AcrR family transcriptional regulator